MRRGRKWIPAKFDYTYLGTYGTYDATQNWQNGFSTSGTRTSDLTRAVHSLLPLSQDSTTRVRAHSCDGGGEMCVRGTVSTSHFSRRTLIWQIISPVCPQVSIVKLRMDLFSTTAHLLKLFPDWKWREKFSREKLFFYSMIENDWKPLRTLPLDPLIPKMYWNPKSEQFEQS